MRFTMSYHNPTPSTSLVPFVLAALVLALSSVPGADAKKICRTDPNGVIHCQEKLSKTVIAAIAATTVSVVLLIVGAIFYIMRTRARKDQLSTLDIEASQISGPPAILSATRGTTYAANYSPASYRYNPASAPALPQLSFAGAGSAPMAYQGSGHGHGKVPYSPGMKMPFSPQTAPHNGGWTVAKTKKGKERAQYPFGGISSTHLPPMPQASGGYPGATGASAGSKGFGSPIPF